jgi:hypothetical protein
MPPYAPKPAAGEGRAREVGTGADGYGLPISSPHLTTQAVADGRTCIGFLLPRGKAGVEAFDAEDASLGIYPTTKGAADAISARAAS